MERKRKKKQGGGEKEGGGGEGEGQKNESGMKKNLCGRRGPPPSPAIRLYAGPRLQSPEKQICRTFRLKCQRAAGIDFLRSSE